ncbi:MAG: hypothetical protein JWM16_4671 [Verrucomicrobiales bacterium]|nr:hypothetical protein [Verrucomicrobiales bacterium]
MLKIELTEFQDEQAFVLDFKTSSGHQRPRGNDSNSISISITPGSQEQCEVSRCFDYHHGANGFHGQDSHGKRPRKSFPAVKPCRPCRVAKARR